jgi:hypothetical protein
VFFKRYGQALPQYDNSPIINNAFFLNAVVQIKSVKELDKNVLENDFKNNANDIANAYNIKNPKNKADLSENFNLKLTKVNDASTNFIKSSFLIFTLFSTLLAYNF